MNQRVFTFAVWANAIVLAAAVAVFFYQTLVSGSSWISLAFFIESPRDSGRAGGVASILVSTCLLMIVCLSFALPIGTAAAAMISETSRRGLWARSVHLSMNVMAAVPSIIYGLFGNAFFCVYLGMGFSILSGGLTLGCMVLPFYVRTVAQGFVDVPLQQRLSAHALGLSRWTIFRRIVLPSAIPSMVAGFVLGVARAMAETAALIFTSGYVDRMPQSVSDSGRALSVHIYDLAMNVPGGDENARRCVFVLVVMLLILNLNSTWGISRLFGKRDGGGGFDLVTLMRGHR